MNNLRVIFLVLLVAGLFAGVIASQAADSGVTPWPSTAEKIRKGEIDVGKEYGMAPDKRFHRIHADTVGLECSTCHADRIPASAQVFSVQLHPRSATAFTTLSSDQNSVGSTSICQRTPGKRLA